MSEWKGYILEDYRIRFTPGSVVLDVGCGPGDQMQMLSTQGNEVIGIDASPGAVQACRSRGLSALHATAERVPFGGATFDGILCKVVLPYTREDQAIGEFGRLLKVGGRCYVQCHGAGYFLKYLLSPPSWKYRIYGLRTLVNTWIWMLTGRRLPGFLGDSIYQSRQRLNRHYRATGLVVVDDTPSKRFLGLPVFIYQIVEKRPTHAPRLAWAVASLTQGLWLL